MPNIAIVWDFDGTLTPMDSTTKVVEILAGEGKGNEFWSLIKSLRGDKKKPKWRHVLASDALYGCTLYQGWLLRTKYL